MPTPSPNANAMAAAPGAAYLCHVWVWDKSGRTWLYTGSRTTLRRNRHFSAPVHYHSATSNSCVTARTPREISRYECIYSTSEFLLWQRRHRPYFYCSSFYNGRKTVCQPADSIERNALHFYFTTRIAGEYNIIIVNIL